MPTQKLMRVAGCLLAAAVSAGISLPAYGMPDYGGGVFIMNEGEWGSNGSVNFFSPDHTPEWSYRVFQRVNPEREIPGAICHAHFHGGNLFIISNHLAADNMTAGTLTVCDGCDLKWVKSLELVNRHGKPVQGRAAQAVDEDRVIISTTDGLLVYSLSANEIVGGYEQFSSPDGVASPELFQYPYQTGSMVRVGDCLYVASQTFGLICLPLTDNGHERAMSLEQLFGGELPPLLSAANGIGSVILGHDGNLWLSVTADTAASGAAAPVIVRYNPYNGEATAIAVPDGIYPPANSWYAWNPDGFHASPNENLLFWNGGDNTWFSNSMIFRYDIDKGEFSKLHDLTAERLPTGEAKWMIYGCSMRTSPVDGSMYVSLYKDYASTKYTLRRLDRDGSKIADYPMEAAAWFPSLPVFFDLENPVFGEMEELTIPADKESRIDLMGAATDKDSPDAGIVYSVKSSSHHWPDYEARCDGRFVTIYPHGVELPPECDAPARAESEGDYQLPTDCWVEIEADSQGFKISKRLRFKFSTSGIDGVAADSRAVSAEVKGGRLELHCDSPVSGGVFTPEGRLAVALDVPAGESSHDLSSLPSGIYILRVGDKVVKFRL